MGNREHVLRAPIDLFHLLTWPQLSFVAQDHKGRIVGYILAKMCVLSILWERLRAHRTQRVRDDDPTEEPHGHVTSISVLRGYRRLGIANRLMLMSRTSPRSERGDPPSHGLDRKGDGRGVQSVVRVVACTKVESSSDRAVSRHTGVPCARGGEEVL